MKYIVFEEDDAPVPMIFEKRLHHDAVAKGIEHAYMRSNDKSAFPISAGFCNFYNGEWFTEGRSESLNLDSRPEDAAILNKFYGKRKT